MIAATKATPSRRVTSARLGDLGATEVTEHEALEVRALGVDAGGTMTDTIIIDRNGCFVVGKAQTTPELEATGFTNSIRDALKYWGLTPDQAFPTMVTGVFSGTSMLNRLLERKGQRVGLLVTRGLEDYFRFERGVQTHLGYSYQDSLHVVTHQHHEPLVPRAHIRGVSGRIDVRGNQAIPLREEEARNAAHDLLDAKVDCICINLVFSWRNPRHEQRVKEIALEVMAERGETVPLFLSSELYPKRLDFPRLNTLVIDAYAAEPSRKQLHALRERVESFGATFDLRVMAGSGNAISIESKQLVTTLASGPIGGCVAAKYLADQMNIPNLVCSDIGGTSFDVALITGGEYEVRTDPEIAHFKLGLPMIRLDSIGAGCGRPATPWPASTCAKKALPRWTGRYASMARTKSIPATARRSRR